MCVTFLNAVNELNQPSHQLFIYLLTSIYLFTYIYLFTEASFIAYIYLHK